MKRRRFTEEQIIGVLKEAGSGAKTADLARRHGVSEATIYNWMAKYGGLEVSLAAPWIGDRSEASIRAVESGAASPGQRRGGAPGHWSDQGIGWQRRAR